jgi:hypothetical protein
VSAFFNHKLRIDRGHWIQSNESRRISSEFSFQEFGDRSDKCFGIESFKLSVPEIPKEHRLLDRGRLIAVDPVGGAISEFGVLKWERNDCRRFVQVPKAEKPVWTGGKNPHRRQSTVEKTGGVYSSHKGVNLR